MTAKVNHQITRHQGRVFKLVTENVTLRNGVTVDIDLIRHPGASAIVAVPEPRKVVLLRQYRHAMGKDIWEIPAGTLDSRDEDPLACAVRELGEETGYNARQWEKLGAVTPLPGYADERIHLFLARYLYSVDQVPDSDEVLEPHILDIDEVLKMIEDGAIEDGKTITGLFLAIRRLGWDRC